MSKERQHRPATSFDVARRAGVSRSAVSRAFTPGASISTNTRNKVMQAAEDLGYRVNQLARGLSNKRSDLIGLIAADMDNPFRSAQVDALAREIVARGYHPILFPADSRGDTAQIVHELLEYRLSGVIVTSHAPSPEICTECVRIGMPLVTVNREEELPNVDCVVGDNIGGGALAAEALLDSGCSDLVILDPQRQSYSVDARCEGFAQRATRAGAKVEVLKSPTQTYEGGRQAADEFFKRTRLDTGVFCPTDYMALGFVDAMRMVHGVRIPEDLCVVGFDDVPQSDWLFARLTTVRQPVEALAAEAVSLLSVRMENPDHPRQTSIATVELVVRGTTRQIVGQP